MINPPRLWRLAHGRLLTLGPPRLMAILNVTPDSFSDGGRLPTVDDGLAAAAQAVRDGADMLDIGGESTRPGAARVEPDEQTRRVIPLVRAIRGATGPVGSVPISVDTTHESVASAAIDAGADAVNDVSAGAESDDATLRLAAARGAGLVLMHRATDPTRDRFSDQYRKAPIDGDIVAAVGGFLRAASSRALAAGCSPESLVLDPGLGFGKTVEQNVELVRRTGELLAIGHPILSGVSRKSFVGRVSLGRDSQPSERLAGTLSFSVMHLLAGASIFRVHDVSEHAGALRAAACLRGGG
jgi:dihydropteroate synthase